MDVYTQDGTIIRAFPQGDGTVRVELEFLFDDLFRSRLFGLTSFYLAFYERLRRDYVVASHTHTKIVMREQDFDADAQALLIETVKQVQTQSDLLLDTAKLYLFDKPSENVETNTLDSLRTQQVTQVPGKVFLEQFATALAAQADEKGKAGTDS